MSGDLALGDKQLLLGALGAAALNYYGHFNFPLGAAEMAMDPLVMHCLNTAIGSFAGIGLSVIIFHEVPETGFWSLWFGPNRRKIVWQTLRDSVLAAAASYLIVPTSATAQALAVFIFTYSKMYEAWLNVY